MKKFLVTAGALALLGFSCSPQNGMNSENEAALNGILSPDQGQKGVRGNLYSLVDENQQPVAGAQVLIGNSLNAPLKDNFIQSDANGQFAPPATWNNEQNMTIDASGFVRVTYMQEEPKPRTIVLKKMKFAPSHEVKGVTTGHPIQTGDGQIDFSLVMSAMSKEDILNLDLNKILSPKSDVITVVGQTLNIPSNVSLPKQKENYIIGITLEKPTYRLYFDDQGPQKIYAARGRFEFKPVVDQLRNNVPFFELINQFVITGGSVRDAQVQGGSTPLDIVVNDYTFTQKKTVQAPEIGSDQVLVAASVSDMNGFMIPTDVKRMNSKDKMTLSVLADRPSLIAQILKRKSEFMVETAGSDRLSGVLVPFTDNNQAQFLTLIADPVRDSDFNFRFDVPQRPKPVNPIATYAVISDLKDGYSIHRWEIYSPEWNPNLDLPHWELGATQAKKRVEVSFVGSLNSTSVEMGPKIIEAATHVTRSSVEY